MKKLKDAAFWQRVKTDAAYEHLRTMIRTMYEESRYAGTIPELGFQRRTRFDRDGDRTEFDGEYFRRRKLLSASAIMALIYPEEPQYLEELQEIIWAVCGEFSWVIPAHEKFSTGDANDFIDLFSAETAFSLAEISYALGERLHPRMHHRIRKEVKWRILRNLERETLMWEHSENNWASVCGCNVGGAVLYLFPEEFPRFLKRLQNAAFPSFYASYPEEGTCLEGLGYWHYGFGTFVWFAELVREYTDGSVDLLQGEKTARMAGFGRRCFLRGDTLINFGEAPRHGRLNAGLMTCLRTRLPGAVKPVPAWMTDVWPGNTPWLELTRNLIWLDTAPAEGTFEPESMDLPDSKQMLVATGKYSLAVRGGDNDVELGQHCDVGNFILSTDEGQIFCDFGSGPYTRDYFDPAYRRDYFNVGSQGHSVPILNGETQLLGKEYCGTISHAGNVITVEMADAYKIESISRFTRTFTHTENAVTLTDSFDPDYDSITERFVTLLRPTAEDGVIHIGASALEYDPTLAPIIQPHSVKDHDGFPETLYTVDFDLPKGLDRVTFVIRP